MARGTPGTADDNSIVVQPTYNPITQQWEYPSTPMVNAPNVVPDQPAAQQPVIPQVAPAAAGPTLEEILAAQAAAAKLAKQQSALSTIKAILGGYDIDVDGTGLSSELWSWIQADKSDDEIMLNVRQSKAYNDRFTGMADLIKRGQAISEAEYITQERSYRAVMTQWGLPTGFYDDYNDYGRFIANGVSVKELDDRIKSAKTFIDSADVSYKDALTSMGLSEGTLLAHVLDGDKAQNAIQRELKAAAFGGAANKYGFGLDAQGMDKYGGLLGDQFNAIGIDEKNKLESDLSQLSVIAKNDKRLSSIDNEDFALTDTLDAQLNNDTGKQLQSQRRALREQARFGGSSSTTSSTLSRKGRA